MGNNIGNVAWWIIFQWEWPTDTLKAQQTQQYNFRLLLLLLILFYSIYCFCNGRKLSEIDNKYCKYILVVEYRIECIYYYILSIRSYYKIIVYIIY